MTRVLQWGLWLFARVVLPLRYRVRVRGLERVSGLTGPTLVLPNHPALIDPPIIICYLWPALRPRPLVFEGNFTGPVLRRIAELVGAVPIPDLEQASAEARGRTQQALDEVIAGLRRGENFVVWPAGRIERAGVERLGAARALADILKAAPEANVVAVRTRGLFGSSFSYAYTGKGPPMARRLRQGLGWLIANALLFMPRRKVEITAEPIDRSRLPELTREAINPWFEAWYNEGAPEKPTFVPYHFLVGPRTREFPPPPGLSDVDARQIKPETRAAVNQMLADKLGRDLPESERRAVTQLDALGLDSLDRMELTLQVEQRFGFRSDQSPMTLGQLWALAQGLAEREPPKPPPPEWFRPPSDPGPLEALGETVAEAFVNRVTRDPKDVAAADDLAGVLTYERVLVGALTLAKRFRTLAAPNVGLMMPASVAGDIAFMALHLAGKLPVVLNWTTGPANLAHAARLLGLTHVVTSKAFLDRSGVSVEGVEYLFLEEVRQSIGRFELLRTLVTVRLLPGRMRANLPAATPDRPAVVLFTSGSEKAPKAVPLTHANLIGLMRAGVPVMGLTRRDSILGFLPAFHSFGLAVTSLLPLMGGMKVVHHPDPTDAAGLVRKIAAYKPTLLVGTPTFVGYILERARPGDLDSLRLIVVGAEAAPPALFEKATRLAPHAIILEGYGITECSPVVSVNAPDNNRPGTLGRPLPGVEVRVVDADTGEPLPEGKLGMLLVSGPTVFPGYIGGDTPSPFRELDGRRWYVTGDLASVDPDGFIRFGGRLKRFLKAGGEMISLPALEEPFARRYPPADEGPRVAVEGVETPGGRTIVLFTTEPIDLRQANAILTEEGFRGIMRLDELRRVDSIPVLGTGKTDYKVLRARIESGG
jgi:long-chain-fatty-acid--[acyl-carrier-protein] ligase